MPEGLSDADCCNSPQGLTIGHHLWSLTSRRWSGGLAVSSTFPITTVQNQQYHALEMEILPENTAPISPLLFSTPRLAAPIEAYRGPHTAMAAIVAAKKGLNGTDERPKR